MLILCFIFRFHPIPIVDALFLMMIIVLEPCDEVMIHYILPILLYVLSHIADVFVLIMTDGAHVYWRLYP
jgi:hypothetical protein